MIRLTFMDVTAEDPLLIRLCTRRRGNELVRLTPRQRDIVALICRGRQNKEIAGDLGISEATVKAYASQIFIRMNLSRAEVMRTYYTMVLQEMQGRIAELEAERDLFRGAVKGGAA